MGWKLDAVRSVRPFRTEQRTHVERIHAPCAAVTAQSEEARNVVAKDHRHEVPAAVEGREMSKNSPGDRSSETYLTRRAVWKISSS